MQSRTNKQIQTPTTFYTVTEARQNPKACKMLSDWFSSFFVHADAKPEESEEQVTNNNGDNRTEGKPEEEEQKDEGETQETPEEEEEEEPEDVHPAIREECSNSAKCAPLKKHFDHCQEKVQGGHGFKGEECVEEMCK